MPIIEFLKVSDNTYKEVSATNPLPTTATISGGTVTADTELPAAAALADATANPTTTSVGALGMGFNGTTWDRLRVDANKSLKTTIVSADGLDNVEVYSGGSDDKSNNTNQLVIGSNQYSFNGTAWDRDRNNIEGTLLASAARTAGITSPTQTNYNAKGVMVFVDVTVASGTGGLQPTIRGVDTLSGKVFTLTATPTAITAVGTYAFELYPSVTGAAVGHITQKTNGVLPRRFLVNVNAGDATSYTYSIGYSLIL